MNTILRNTSQNRKDENAMKRKVLSDESLTAGAS